MLRVRTIGYFKEHKWWYGIGHIYEVELYHWRATADGTINSCQCKDCKERRYGIKLYDMYVDIQTGGIIPRKFCIIVQ